MGAPKNFEFHFRVLKCWRGLGEWSPQKPPPPFSGGKALRPFCLWPWFNVGLRLHSRHLSLPINACLLAKSLATSHTEFIYLIACKRSRLSVICLPICLFAFLGLKQVFRFVFLFFVTFIHWPWLLLAFCGSRCQAERGESFSLKPFSRV